MVQTPSLLLCAAYVCYMLHDKCYTNTLSPFPELAFSSRGFVAEWSHFHLLSVLE